MSPLAHVGGVPVEELLPFAPVVWVAIGGRLAAAWRARRQTRTRAVPPARLAR